LADVPGASSAEFTVKIEGPQGQAVEGRLEEGPERTTLEVVFRPPVPGLYTISVEHKGEAILNSPFRLQVAPPPGMSA
jgi:hypothetical protein